MPYRLSATLSGHSSDVRAVTSPSNDLVLSASRDSTAISWSRSPPAPSFSQSAVFHASTRYINAITYLPSSPDAQQGYVVTAGQDAVINVFDLAEPRDEPTFSLIGHSENVCKLNATASGNIISGSWDKTAKVWKGFQLVHDLKGHAQAVWAVIAVNDDQYLTGSADKTIRLWQQHKTLRTFSGHQDAVRDLALVSDIGFVSCSNDSEIRVWTLEGDLVYTLSGHTSFVYSLSILPNGDIVSGGEDRTVRVWRDGECAQTIVHPAISVWAVSTMPNGDIISGCSDGVVRVFSCSDERWASQEELKAFDDQVSSQSLPSQQVGDVKKSDLPGIEALSAPGKKDGEVKMIQNGDKVEAHQWDSSANTWQKIGDVVDAVGSGRKQLHDGKEYDYVFDVDIQEGALPLKLPYNANENPFVAAQRFLQSNDLPLSYIDEVVRFIEKNTAGLSIGGNNEFVDPYTGANRYQSSASSVPTTNAPATYSDPFTGASRYMGTPTTPSVSRPVTSILPVRIPLAFKQANVPAMQGKLYQLNDDLNSEISTSSLALYPEEITSLDEAFTYLSQAVASPSTPVAPQLTASHIDTIRQILDRWPSSQRFPVIDLARLAIGFCPSAFAGPGQEAQFFESLFRASDWTDSWSDLPKSRATNILLLFRALANAFQEWTPSGGFEWIEPVLENLSQPPYESLNKTQRVTLATILFNLSCKALNGPLDATAVAFPAVRHLHLNLLARILRSEVHDSETAYRALVALGNSIYAMKSQNIALDGAQVTEFKFLVSGARTRFKEERIQNVADEIQTLL